MNKHTFLNKAMMVTLSTLAILCISFLPLQAGAAMSEKVTTYQDSNGWKLKVDGNDFYVKGVVWGYSPVGENYSYNLWAQPEEFIKKVLEQEFSLLRDAGVNTIRQFGVMPPEWVTYVYETYGIRTVINHLFGRYGFTINGEWRPNTNYEDPLTRETIKKDVLALVEKYKDVPGVLMFALGNENNYGLEWSSFEIENLPEGERHRGKAKHLYSLFNETIKAAKQIDSTHPYTIVNGDIQYLDLIVELCPDLDVLGSNVYRGISFTSLWKDVKKTYDLPVLFFEFGSDAFNARTNREDQQAQAVLLKGMWQEMYNKAYGKNEEGNSIGGFVFEWRDEWWKYKQTENLDVQDTTASWANGGYEFDFEEGKNNMNEEWYGITRIGDIDSSGIYATEPRMAYDVLKEIWKLDPYQDSKSTIKQSITNINMELLELRSEVRLMRSSGNKNHKFSMTGGNISGEVVLTAEEKDLDLNGRDGIKFSNGEMITLDFAFQPTNEIKGQFSLNILGNSAEKKIMRHFYGDRTQPVVITNDQALTGETTLTDNQRIEIYDFEVTYENSDYSLTGFYHVPRFHWKHKGDYFGLLDEATDMEGMDIWNGKAPFGMEYVGKKQTKGLTILFGPEVYWGANPKVIAKYDFDLAGQKYTFIHSEDLGQAAAKSNQTEALKKRISQTTLYNKSQLFENYTLEMGGMISSREKVGERYDYYDGSNIIEDEIKLQDALAFKAKVSTDVSDTARAYVAFNRSGLVADGGDPLAELGTKLPYSDLGNKFELEGGVLFNMGTYTVFPKFLVRNNIISANPSIAATSSGSTFSPGIDPRNLDADPFAVLGNREARSAEVVFTWDETPGSHFYDWDNDKREDAGLAYNIVLNYTQYPSNTDSSSFYYREAERNAPFGQGQVAEDLWLISSRMIMNPSPARKIITNLEAGYQQSTGKPGNKGRRYTTAQLKIVNNNKYIHEAYIKKDMWGPYDYHREFDITYPLQFMYDFSILLDSRLDEDKSSKWGTRILYRTIDSNAADDYLSGTNTKVYEISTYYKVNF